MKYKGHDVKTITWSYGKPWPETIELDGIRMEYAGIWTSRAARQIIYYRQAGTVRLHEVARSAFVQS